MTLALALACLQIIRLNWEVVQVECLLDRGVEAGEQLVADDEELQWVFRAEAADVLAETLLDLWLRERRARREAGVREPREGGRSA